MLHFLNGQPGPCMIQRGGGVQLCCIASNGLGWEHVSVHATKVSGKNRLPTWGEMCAVKELFWEPDDWVIQFHPPKSANINVHDTTLHLWRCTIAPQPLPHPEMV